MKTTHPTPFIQVEHDEFEEKTTIKVVYQSIDPENGHILTLPSPISYESSKDGDYWQFTSKKYESWRIRVFLDKIILRCDSNNVILQNSIRDSQTDQCYFKISNADAKRIAEATSVEAKLYKGKENWPDDDCYHVIAFLETGIKQSPYIFAVQAIFNYLDNEYSDKIKDYTQQNEEFLKQKQAQLQAEQQAQQQAQQAQIAAENEKLMNNRIMAVIAFIGAATAFFGFFYALDTADSWWIPICGAVGCVTGVVYVLRN